MQALAFWKTVTVDRAGFLEELVQTLTREGIRYCVIDGQGVNAYAEPVVSLDLDLAVAVADLPKAVKLLGAAKGSDLRVQLQKDPRYAAFVERATTRLVLGLDLPVAAAEDVLTGKVWAVQDPGRRASKRQKDLADIARLLEVRPDLRPLVPDSILSRLLR